MDPIETYIVKVIGINISGHHDLYDLTNSYGAALNAWANLDTRLRGDRMSRLKWSRYNVLFCFARARYLCMDVFCPLMKSTEVPDGQMHYRRLAALFDCFRVIGTLLDSLAEEANVIYEFGLTKDKVTITYLRSRMAELQKTGAFASSQQQEFIQNILPMIQHPQTDRVFQFRHVATHRPKLRRISGDSRSMFLPIDPTLDPDDDRVWNTSSYQPKDCPADVDLTAMVSRVTSIVEECYMLSNKHFEELYVTP